MIPQVILTISTGVFCIVAVLACLATIKQAELTRSQITRARRFLASVEDVEDRLQALERGEDTLTQRIHQQVGRLGALVARVNNLAGEAASAAAERATDEPPDPELLEQRREAEREKLRALLAEKAHRG